MEKREFCMLAHKYDANKTTPNGFFASEKLDGQRALWLPWTRGDHVSEIPFANRERDSRDHVSTGLWSRYGKPIHAPPWWLDKLPPDQLLDGELYLGRGQFQTLSSCIRKHPAQRSDSEWKPVRYHVFDVPSVQQFFSTGRIYSPNFKTVFDNFTPPGFQSRGDAAWDIYGVQGHNFTSYEAVSCFLQAFNFGHEPVALWHPQRQLPFHTENAINELSGLFSTVLELGGEGIILRKYSQLWEPRRSHNLLKMKPTNDAEGRIIGFTLGVTGGKLEGLIGALIVAWDGKVFELSGFTDQERSLHDAESWYRRFNDKERIFPDQSNCNFSPIFKLGETITFSYRELSDGGIPKEARYFRKRPYGSD